MALQHEALFHKTLLSFALMQKKVTKKKSRLSKNISKNCASLAARSELVFPAAMHRREKLRQQNARALAFAGFSSNFSKAFLHLSNSSLPIFKLCLYPNFSFLKIYELFRLNKPRSIHLSLPRKRESGICGCGGADTQ